MEFRVLGELEVVAGGSRLVLGHPGDQKVLGLLLVHVGRVVLLARLVDALWEEHPPATAAKQVRNAVSRLRRLLADAGAPGVIQTRGSGYLVSLDGAVLDLAEFEAKTAAAGAAAAAGRCGEAARLLGGALGLWRGPLLAGMDGSVFRDLATGWEERRCAAAESYYDHQLALGRHHEAVAGLSRFAQEHPLREKPVGQLMVALYRCGRQADALSLYAATRERLATGLGLDPGPELQALHQQVLTADPSLATPPAGNGADHAASDRSPVVGVPRQLPTALRHFTGRCRELKALTELLDQVGAGAGTVVVATVGGTAGAGKTALALHWAHQVAGHFPDGQLYVNLRGFDPTAAPMNPAEAIRGFLDAYHVPAGRIPASAEAQAALYRSLMAGKRALLVLDNARDPAQVRPLLPASSGCLAIVTSRHQLTSLIADGAQPLTLGLFTPEEAHDFLTRRLGAERTAADPAAAAELTRLCARLPLALGITAALALAQPKLPLATLTAQLHDTTYRLDTLDAGDATTGIRPVLSWSYRNLSPSAARLFRLLGLHPGPDINTPAAASLAGIPRHHTHQALAELTHAHLVTQHLPGRYTLHDLLRAYAAELADRHDSDDERQAARRRMLDHYLHTAFAAAMILYPTRQPVAVQVPGAGAAPQPLVGYQQAFAWCEAEYRVLLALAKQAAAAGFDRHAWQIPWALAHFLNRRGLWQEQLATQQVAVAAAGRLGDTDAQARAHYHLGDTYRLLGDHDLARRHLTQALALFEGLGDQANAEHGLAQVDESDHDYRHALAHARRALRHYQAADHRPGEAAALNATGWYLSQLGAHEEAVEHCQRALAAGRELGDPVVAAAALDSLGYAWRHLGRHDQALACYREAAEILEQLGDRPQLASTLTRLGDAQAAAGDLSAAQASWHQARQLLADLDHPDAHNILARLHPRRSAPQ
ncbi:MAG TPA: BTAD domain-containing putative transcriptional regulator [Streptosporangiaceae bacterium]|nr:BTAD domain-containing putative transcriptional regulator [Streptosporangiaceae bacterium]